VLAHSHVSGSTREHVHDVSTKEHVHDHDHDHDHDEPPIDETSRRASMARH
jgi:hypothetical protein